MNLPIFRSIKAERMGNHIQMLQGALPGNSGLSVGIDPGVNFGMTIINQEYVQVFYGKLATDKRPGFRGINAYNYIMQSVLSSLFYTAKEVMQTFPAIVEGAAYNDKYGQVTLEEVRFGFFFALYNLGFDVHIIPPATIRKIAVGHGRHSLIDDYPSMNQNAADSIGAALAGLHYKETNEAVTE